MSKDGHDVLKLMKIKFNIFCLIEECSLSLVEPWVAQRMSAIVKSLAVKDCCLAPSAMVEGWVDEDERCSEDLRRVVCNKVKLEG